MEKVVGIGEKLESELNSEDSKTNVGVTDKLSSPAEVEAWENCETVWENCEEGKRGSGVADSQKLSTWFQKADGTTEGFRVR